MNGNYLIINPDKSIRLVGFDEKLLKAPFLVFTLYKRDFSVSTRPLAYIVDCMEITVENNDGTVHSKKLTDWLERKFNGEVLFEFNNLFDDVYTTLWGDEADEFDFLLHNPGIHTVIKEGYIHAYI